MSDEIRKFETPQEFLKAYQDLEIECAGFKHQMEVNNTYARCYESALETIAGMCGWEKPERFKGSITGCPPPDIDSIAINAVKAMIEAKSK